MKILDKIIESVLLDKEYNDKMDEANTVTKESLERLRKMCANHKVIDNGTK